jgi:hypothetical protein
VWGLDIVADRLAVVDFPDALKQREAAKPAPQLNGRGARLMISRSCSPSAWSFISRAPKGSETSCMRDKISRHTTLILSGSASFLC